MTARPDEGSLRLTFLREGAPASSRPVATIGICAKNCEATVKEAIQSIVDQDFRHELLELIVVDDGSKDKTLQAILDSVSRIDINVKVFHSKWRGLGPSRNVVVDNASGDYIIWVDGDMTLPKDHVRRQLEFMRRNPKAGIAKAKYGMYSSGNLAASLENIQFVVMSTKYEGKTDANRMGAGGSIYRVRAIRQVGGFDNNIKGAGEDIDAAQRQREAGWLLCMSTALFYERREEQWKALWNQYFWYGYGMHYVLHKHDGMLNLYKMLPPAGFLAGLLICPIAYKLTRRKTFFLIPFHCAFEMSAWCIGFFKSHMDSRGIAK